MISEYLFVYGSLRKYCENNHLLKNAEYIGEYVSKNTYFMFCYKTKKFPYLIEDIEIKNNKQKTFIKGDIYKINLQHLKKIDEFESCPDIYIRKKYYFTNDTNILEAWVYILNSKQIINYIKEGIDKDYYFIESGDWMIK